MAFFGINVQYLAKLHRSRLFELLVCHGINNERYVAASPALAEQLQSFDPVTTLNQYSSVMPSSAY